MTVDTAPSWTLRFTATKLGFPSWSAIAPDRLAVIANRSGSSQAWAHDLAEGSWRQASAEPIGVEATWVLPDGRIAWWQDTTGAERGRLVAVPFDGGEPTTVFPEIPDGWLMGLSFAAGPTSLGVEVDGIYVVYVIENDAHTREVARFKKAAGVGSQELTTLGGLSPDGTLVCLRHAEHGDILHYALRVLDADSGETVADLVDDGRHLDPVAWSPDGQSLALTSERGPFERPAVWWPRTGERRDVAVDLPGAVFPVAWFADGGQLARHEFEGRSQLLRLDVETGEFQPLTELAGDIEGAAIRPDGDVWLAVSDAVHPLVIRDTSGAVVVANPDPDPPQGRPYESRFATNPSGDRIHMLVVTPEGDGPHPTVMNIHGGPEWHERDRFDAETQAFVDSGYAVALVNYRGSTGYGTAFREALIQRVCLTESEDILACLDALIADGTTDPSHVYWNGWSWGGCLACFHAGAHPDRFRALFAGIPAGDFVAAHWASAPELQAWDQAVHGGSPDQAPDSFRQSDPMTYVDGVTAPILIIAGEHDPRCPIEGITPWVEAVRAKGVEVEMHTYTAGHHANDMHQQVQHMHWVLDFFARNA